MLVYVKGNLLSSPAKVLVNPVNTVGIMGKGLADEFKHLYPEMFKQYQALCENKQFSVGQLWLYKTPRKWVLNFPTKQHWRKPSQLEFIELGLQKFVATYEQKDIRSIAFPQLGCGNGELDWEQEVQPLMERYLRPLKIEMYIHLFDAADPIPEHRMTAKTREVLQAEPRSIPFVEFWDGLVEQINRQAHYQAWDTGDQFTVTIADKEAGILLNVNDDPTIFIAKDEEGLLALWQYFRSVPYCVADYLPAGLDRYGSFLVVLLATLPYVRRVELVRANKPQYALTLNPPPTDKPLTQIMLTPVLQSA